jgi:hypothetical protein
LTEILQDVTIPVCLVVSLSFWLLLYDPVYHNQRFYSNLYEHGLNSVIILVDIFILGGQEQIHPRNVVRPLAVSIFYCLFTIVYTYLGGTDVLGQNFVYPILDWKKNCSEACTTAGLTILAIPILYFSVSFLQNKVTSCCNGKTKPE